MLGLRGYSREGRQKVPVLTMSWCFNSPGFSVDAEKLGCELAGGGNQVRRLLVKGSDVPGYLKSSREKMWAKACRVWILEGDVRLGVNLKSS